MIFAGDDTTDEDAMRVNVCTRISLPIYLDPILTNLYLVVEERENSINLQNRNSNLIKFMIRHTN